MSIKDAVQNLLGGSESDDESTAEKDEPPSHICRSCGETYHTDPEMEIETCRNCGGIKVEAR